MQWKHSFESILLSSKQCETKMNLLKCKSFFPMFIKSQRVFLGSEFSLSNEGGLCECGDFNLMHSSVSTKIYLIRLSKMFKVLQDIFKPHQIPTSPQTHPIVSTENFQFPLNAKNHKNATTFQRPLSALGLVCHLSEAARTNQFADPKNEFICLQKVFF